MKSIITLLVIVSFSITGFSELNAQYSWSQLNYFSGNSRSGAVSFVIGDTAYVGLGRNGSTYYADFWKYNPSTDTWKKVADFAGGARSNAVAFSLNNKGYVATGLNGSTRYKDLWEYDPATNQWTKKTDFGGTARSGAVAFTINNKAYVGTGTDGAEKKDLLEYDPQLNVWTSKANLASDARQAASAFSINGKGYICAGVTYSSGTMMTNDVYEYNPSTNTWAEKSFAESHLARTGAASFVMNNKAYICGGSGKKDLWEYTPSTNTWVKLADIGPASETNRNEATAFSVKNMGFVTCGSYMIDINNIVVKSDVWVYAPPKPPKAPSSLAANSISSKEVYLTWHDNSNDETKFILEKSIGDNQHYQFQDSISANRNYCYDSNLNDSSTYFYKIRAINSVGTSDYSNELTVTTRFEKIVLSAIPYSMHSITLLWSHNTLRKYKYYIERSSNDNTNFVMIDSAENTKEWMDSTLSDGNRYYYRLFVKFGNKKLYSNYNYAITGKQGGWKRLAQYPGYNSFFSFMVGRKYYTGINGYDKIELYEYDADRNSWVKKSDFPGEFRDNPCAFTIGDKGYVGVGYKIVNNQFNYYQDFWEYNPVTDTWKKIADFPGTGRQLTICLTVNGLAYVGLGYGQNSLKDLWQYNPANNNWTKMADSPVVLNYPTGFALGNLCYFGFGWNTPLLYSFDPASNQWTKKNDFTDLSLDNSSYGSQFTFAIGDKAYLMAPRLNSFWEYNPQNDTWVRKNGYSNVQGPSDNKNLAGSDGKIALFYPGSENMPGSSTSGGSFQNFYLFDPSGIATPSKLRIAESSKKTVTLKWFHDDPDSKYVIERIDNSQITWKAIDSTKIGVKSYTDTTLKENITYQYRVYAKNTSKVSDYSDVVYFRAGTPELVSINRVVSKFKDNSLTITCYPNIQNCADGYYLERSDESNPSEYTPVDTFDYTQQNFTDKNLTIGKWYYYRIKGFNKFGTTISGIVRGRVGDVCIFNGSIKTDKATIIDENGYDVEYNRCSNSQLTIYPETAGNKVLLTMDEISYNRWDTIYIYNGSSNTSPLIGKVFGKTLTNYFFAGNNPEGSLTIRSKGSCTGDGGGYSGFKATVVSEKYCPPSELKTTPTTQNINLSWKDNSTNENYFIIERSEGNPDNFVKFDSVSSDVTKYTDLSVKSNVVYFYKVRMKCGKEYSSYTDIMETMLLPASPEAFALQLKPDEKLRFNWTDKADNESGYIISLSYDDSLHYVSIDTVKADVDSFIYKPQYDYVFYFQVRALNFGGLSGGSKSIPFILLRTPVLNNPSVVATNSAQLTWKDNSYTETGYVVERSENDTLHFTNLISLAANTSQYLDQNQATDKNYYYRVKAIHTNGTSLYSAIKSRIYVTAMEDLSSENQIVLYPNPASDIIYLKNETLKEIKQFRIYNSLGSIVRESRNEKTFGAVTPIDLSGFAPGFYSIQILLVNKTQTLHFIIQ